MRYAMPCAAGYTFDFAIADAAMPVYAIIFTLIRFRHYFFFSSSPMMLIFAAFRHFFLRHYFSFSFSPLRHAADMPLFCRHDTLMPLRRHVAPLPCRYAIITCHGFSPSLMPLR